MDPLAEPARFLRASVHVRVRSAKKICLTTRAHTSALPSGPRPTATQNASRSKDRLAARVWGLARRAGKERSWAAQREMGSGPNRAFAAQLGYFPFSFVFIFYFLLFTILLNPNFECNLKCKFKLI